MPVLIPLILSALKKLWPYILCAIVVSFIWIKIHTIQNHLKQYEVQKQEISTLQDQVNIENKTISDIQNSYNNLISKNNEAKTTSQKQKTTFKNIINSNGKSGSIETELSNSVNAIFDNISGGNSK